MANFIDLTSQVFGHLTVVSRAVMPEHKHKLSYWTCVCKCLCEVTVRSDDLRSGRVYSCKECRRNFQMRAVFNVVYDGQTRFGNGGGS